jgi:transcriptional regulator of arginine metabolism
VNERERRQKALAELIRTEALGSQEEVTARLSAMGLAVTQGTVSRDLEGIGAVKVKRAAPCATCCRTRWKATSPPGRMERIMAEWVRSVEAAGNLLVLKTPPGSAHLVGSVIDGAALPEVAGCVSGDDTLFVALRDGVTPGAMAERFRAWAGNDGRTK